MSLDPTPGNVCTLPRKQSPSSGWEGIFSFQRQIIYPSSGNAMRIAVRHREAFFFFGSRHCHPEVTLTFPPSHQAPKAATDDDDGGAGTRGVPRGAGEGPVAARAGPRG